MSKVGDGYDEGGTNSTVEIQFVGEDGRLTEWKVLDHWFYNNFEQGNTDKFSVNLLDVGMPCMINISKFKKFLFCFMFNTVGKQIKIKHDEKTVIRIL